MEEIAEDVEVPIDEIASSIKAEETYIICQERFELEQRIGTLGCGHEYHVGCIKQWLLIKKIAPHAELQFCPSHKQRLYKCIKSRDLFYFDIELV